MADKESEAWYVECLRSLWAGFPHGPRTPSENPDFLVRARDKTVGVEVTEFTLPPEEGKQPTRERLNVRQLIVARAQAIHNARDGRALLIDIEFSGEVRLTKRN